MLKSNKSKHLVATALHSSKLNKHQEITYLGEWARLHGDVDENSTSSVIPYHWDDRNKLNKDSIYLDKVYEKVLALLANKLNEIHHSYHELRYWRIILGPWLITFISVLFDRWEIIRSLAATGEKYTAEFRIRIDEHLIPQNYHEFERAIISDHWNDAIFSLLILERCPNSVQIKWTDVKKKSEKTKKYFPLTSRYKHTFFKAFFWNRIKIF